MAKFFYVWEDKIDPYATGVPDLGRHPKFRLYSKAAVRKDWKEYCRMFKDVRPMIPKIRVWKISCEEVTL